MALTPEPGFTIETVGVPPPAAPTLRGGFATILILAALCIRDGVVLARESIRDGRAMKKLETLISTSNELAAAQ